ncbi:MAG: DUF2185 domain-containing protein [Phycisphaerales bacterium]
MLGKLFGRKKNSAPGKSFKLAPDEIRQLVPPMGACIATDKITVEGEPVGWMYREPPGFQGDSGWRFFSGTETEAYLDNAQNSGMYEVNTIANYDPDIVEFLTAPTNSAFARDSVGSPLRPADPPVAN